MSETDVDAAETESTELTAAGVEAPAAGRETALDAAWSDAASPVVTQGQLWLSFLAAWTVVVLGALVILVVPLGLVAWAASHWLPALLVILLCGALALPLVLGVLVWWLAVTVTLGTKCPSCGDVLVASTDEDVPPGPGGRRRCENCLAPVIERRR